MVPIRVADGQNIQQHTGCCFARPTRNHGTCSDASWAHYFFLGANCRCFRKRSTGQSRDSVRHASTEKRGQPVPLCSWLCVPGTTLCSVTGRQQHLCVPHGCPARHVFPLQEHQTWAWNSTLGSFAGSIYTSKRFVLNMCSAPLGWSLTGI